MSSGGSSAEDRSCGQSPRFARDNNMAARTVRGQSAGLLRERYFANMGSISLATQLGQMPCVKSVVVCVEM